MAVVVEQVALKSICYLSIWADDADAATNKAVAIYKEFLTRLYGDHAAVRNLRVDMEDPVPRKGVEGVFDAHAVLRAEVPTDFAVFGQDSYLGAWREVVRRTFQRVTRDFETEVYRTASYVALTRPVVPGEDTAADEKDDKPQVMVPIVVTLKGQTHQIEIPQDNTVLDGVLDKGLDMQFECKAGVCDKCKVKVLEGMENLPPVNDSEVEQLGDLIQQGYRLSCQVTTKGPVKIAQD